MGASRNEILGQFLIESVMIVGGGIVGILIGIAVPLSVRLLSDFEIPLSPLSILTAFIVSFRWESGSACCLQAAQPT